MSRYTFPVADLDSNSQDNYETMSGKVATQAFLYNFFFFITWIFPMVTFAVSVSTGSLYFPLLTLATIFTPMQGFFDAIIYLRPRYLKYRRRQREHGGIRSRIVSVVRAMASKETGTLKAKLTIQKRHQKGSTVVPQPRRENTSEDEAGETQDPLSENP